MSTVPITELNLSLLACSSKANLLTLGHGEGSTAFIAGAKQGVRGAPAQKTNYPMGFREGALKAK